jgi:hypothetical protein
MKRLPKSLHKIQNKTQYSFRTANAVLFSFRKKEALQLKNSRDMFHILKIAVANLFESDKTETQS